MIPIRTLLLIILTTLNVISQQWVQTSGPEGGNVKDIKQANGYIFAACNSGGVFRSSNNGTSWMSKSDGIYIYSRYIETIAFCNGITYAGGDHLWKSANNGDNWTLDTGVTFYVESMSSIGTKVLAGTISGLYISSNNGVTWNESNSGLDNRYLLTLKVNSNKIYAGTRGGGVYVSNDSGSSWISINGNLPDLFINDIEVLNGNLYVATGSAKIYKSTNNGLTWFFSGNGIINLAVISLAIHNNILFAGTHMGGIFRSTNEGASWETVNNGLQVEAISNALESINNVLFTGMSGDGIYRSADNGNGWIISNTGLVASDITAIAKCSAGILAAATRRVYLSTDDGNTWQLRSSGLSGIYLSALLVSNNDIYAGSSGYHGMYLSTNNGLSWSNINNGLPSFVSINCLASKGNYVFAGTYNGVFYTTNRGEQWYGINSGINDSSIYSLLSTSSEVFLGNPAGVFKSTNNGTNWINSSSGLPQWPNVTSLCYNNGIIFAATYYGVYISTNNGLSWIHRTTNPDLRKIISSGNNLLGSSYPSGIYYSPDNSLNWYPYGTGFTSTAECLFAADSTVFAGSFDRGVFKTPKNIIGIKNINSEVPQKFMLYQNYPNPFNPVTKIKFSLPNSSEGGAQAVKLFIYDLLGKEVKTLLNEKLHPGIYETEWDGTDYPSGVYFYVLKTWKYSVTKKMILLK